MSVRRGSTVTALLRSAERRFFYKARVSKGILRIKDILNAYDNFLSFKDLKDTFDVRGTFLDYGCLLAAMPIKIGKMLSHIRGTQREYNSKPLKHSIVKCILVFKR